MTDNLYAFYAFSHKKILLIPSNDNKATDFSQLSQVMGHFDVSHRISKYPQIVKALADKINANKDYYTEMEKKILDKLFFERKPVSLIDVFLNLPEDSSLKKRLNQVLKDTDECFICMDKNAEIVFQCAHQMCTDCYPALPDQSCPFCREQITSKMNKVEFAKLQAEKEQKAKEEAERKQKEMEQKIADGTYNWYTDYQKYHIYVEPKQNLPKLTFVEDHQEYLSKRLTTILNIKGALSSKDIEEISVLCDYAPETVWDRFSKAKIASEEVVCQVIACLFKKLIKFDKSVQLTAPELEWMQKLEEYLLTPNKILRFLAVLGGKPPRPDQRILTKMPVRLKKFIVYLLDRCGETARTYAELVLHRPIWKVLFRSFHAADKKKFGKYKIAQKIITWVRTNEPAPVKSKLSTLENMITKKSPKIFDFLLKNPGLFYRNARRVAIEFTGYDGWKDFIPKMVNELKTDQLLQLSYVLETDNSNEHLHESYMNKLGVMHWQKKRKVPEVKETTDLIKALNNKLFESKGASCCILDDTNNTLANTYLRRGKVPSPVEWTSKIPASRADTVNLESMKDNNKDEVVIGVYWKNGSAGRIDLDVSTCGLDKDFKHNAQWKCDYTSLTGFNGAATHSGDITDAPEGASEYIRFNPKKLKAANPGLQYLLVSCFSFNGVPFEKMGEALVWIGKKTDIKGDGPYDTEVIDACKLEGNSQVNTGAYIDLEKMELVFTNLNLGTGDKKKKGKGNYNSVASREKLLSSNIEHFVTWKMTKSCPPSWKFVAEKVAACHDEVIMKLGDRDLHFKRKDNETKSKFYLRLQLQQGEELKLEDTTLSERPDPCVYIGENCTMKLPPKSTIVSCKTPEVEDETIVHLSDPARIFA
jgi:hypothetical protein